MSYVISIRGPQDAASPDEQKAGNANRLDETREFVETLTADGDTVLSATITDSDGEHDLLSAATPATPVASVTDEFKSGPIL